MVKRGPSTPRERTRQRAGAFLGRFEVKKMRFLIKRALWLYTEMCLLLERGTHFQKKRETKIKKIMEKVIGNKKMEP